jgi:hypothetical protein
MMGEIPSRPSQDLWNLHGLNDDIWNLMNSCWSRDPMLRPTATGVALYFQLMQAKDIDQRPLDNFDICSPSQVLHSQEERCFFALSCHDEDDSILQTWQGVSIDQGVQRIGVPMDDVGGY